MPTLFIFLILVVMALISWFTNIKPIISFGIGTGLGSILMLLVIRKLGRRAYRSPLCREIVFNLTAYRIKQKQPLEPIIRKTEAEPVISKTDNDCKEIQSVLRDRMKFSPAETKEALDYILANIPYATLEIKIREALRYLGNGHKEVILK